MTDVRLQCLNQTSRPIPSDLPVALADGDVVMVLYTTTELFYGFTC